MFERVTIIDEVACYYHVVLTMKITAMSLRKWWSHELSQFGSRLEILKEMSVGDISSWHRVIVTLGVRSRILTLLTD